MALFSIGIEKKLRLLQFALFRLEPEKICQSNQYVCGEKLRNFNAWSFPSSQQIV